ncbi:MAG: O-antigen ligase family protein [bacterium]
MTGTRASLLTWLGVGLSAAVIALGVAYAPAATGILIPLTVVAAGLAWRYGAARGLWYAFLISIPLRQPLGYDLFGTTTVFLSDLILYALFLSVLSRSEVVSLWRQSRQGRVGLGILLLSIPGLYTAASLVQQVATIQRLVGQLMVLYLVRHFVRDPREAVRTLGAFLIGMLPAIAFGFYQTTISVGASNFGDWADVPLAHDETGRSYVRVFSTFDHSLRFSHALTVSFAVSLGLAMRATGARRIVLLAITIASAACNAATYSISGVLGMAAALGAAVLIRFGRKALLALPILAIAAWVLLPDAMIYKASQMVTGESTSTLSRLVTYHRTVLVLADHPLTGLGWGSIGADVFRDYRIARSESIGVGAENWWLHHGLALGIPGLILAGMILVFFFRDATRHAREWPRTAILVGGLGYFVQAMLYPSAGFVAGYVLWILIGLSERMAVASRAT